MVVHRQRSLSQRERERERKRERERERAPVAGAGAQRGCEAQVSTGLMRYVTVTKRIKRNTHAYAYADWLKTRGFEF
jgi:hypothetical protein